MSADGPVYITGLDRSGKTTMRAFLASHSRIAIPAVGSNMWMYFYRRYGDLAVPANLDRCLDAMLRYKHVVFLQPDEEAIREDFAGGPPTYARLFAIFLAHHARSEGKPRWGAQSGLEEQYADEMFDAYPGLRMIQMIRDPRDRYEASLEKWPGGRGRAGGAAARWAYSVGHAERNLRRHGDSYLVVRFEDLVCDPTGQLQRVCAFLGEDFEPAMLDMPAATKQRHLLEQGSGEGAILSAEWIGRHRGSVPSDEIRFLDTVLGRRMRRWGYAVDREDTGGSWWVRSFPDHAVRMVAWRLVEGISRRAPRRLGRTPGDRMIVERVGTT